MSSKETDDQDLDDELYNQLDHFVSVIDGPEKSMPIDLLTIMIDDLRISHLTQLHLRGSKLSTRLDDTHVIKLVSSLISAGIMLEQLTLSFHRITDIGLEEITRLLQSSIFSSESKHEAQGPSPRLSLLNLEGNDIAGDVIDQTCLISKFDCPLAFLNLSSNPLSAKGQENISLVVENNQNLQHLLLNSSGMDLYGLSSLCARLFENKSLVSLSLDRPILTKSVGGEVTENLSKILLSHGALENLSLKYHSIPDHGAKLLADSINISQRIISLNLECNKIGVAGAEALASNLLILKTRCMQFLGLSFNFVSDDGAIALAEAISSNCGLKVLTLKNNKIGPRGLMALAQALESSRNLESISLFGNHFDNDTGKKYMELCQQRFTYTNFHIDLSVYVVDGLYQIAEH